jgi:hypothetical protein
MVKMTIGTSVGQPVRRSGNAAPGQPALVAPVLLRAPQLSGSGRMGTALTADPGLWSGTPAPSLTLNWQRDGADIPGASGTGYVPGPADDLRAIRCRVTATNAAGTASAVTAAVTAIHVAPVRSGTLPDLSLVQDSGPQIVNAAAAFAGAALVFGASGAGATVVAQTGAVSIPTDRVLDGATVTVTATNSGGTAEASFRVDVTASQAPAGPQFSADSTLGYRVLSEAELVPGIFAPEMWEIV